MSTPHHQLLALWQIGPAVARLRHEIEQQTLSPTSRSEARTSLYGRGKLRNDQDLNVASRSELATSWMLQKEDARSRRGVPFPLFRLSQEEVASAFHKDRLDPRRRERVFVQQSDENTIGIKTQSYPDGDLRDKAGQDYKTSKLSRKTSQLLAQNLYKQEDDYLDSPKDLLLKDGGRKPRSISSSSSSNCSSATSAVTPLMSNKESTFSIGAREDQDENAEEFDVAIVGGGIAGCFLAYHLARFGDQNLKILLVERESPGAGATGLSMGTLFPLFSRHLIYEPVSTILEDPDQYVQFGSLCIFDQLLSDTVDLRRRNGDDEDGISSSLSSSISTSTRPSPSLRNQNGNPCREQMIQAGETLFGWYRNGAYLCAPRDHLRAQAYVRDLHNTFKKRGYLVELLDGEKAVRNKMFPTKAVPTQNYTYHGTRPRKRPSTHALWRYSADHGSREDGIGTANHPDGETDRKSPRFQQYFTHLANGVQVPELAIYAPNGGMIDPSAVVAAVVDQLELIPSFRLCEGVSVVALKQCIVQGESGWLSALPKLRQDDKQSTSSGRRRGDCFYQLLLEGPTSRLPPLLLAHSSTEAGAQRPHFADETTRDEKTQIRKDDTLTRRRVVVRAKKLVLANGCGISDVLSAGISRIFNNMPLPPVRVPVPIVPVLGRVFQLPTPTIPSKTSLWSTPENECRPFSFFSAESFYYWDRVRSSLDVNRGVPEKCSVTGWGNDLVPHAYGKFIPNDEQNNSSLLIGATREPAASCARRGMFAKKSSCSAGRGSDRVGSAHANNLSPFTDHEAPRYAAEASAYIQKHFFDLSLPLLKTQSERQRAFSPSCPPEQELKVGDQPLQALNAADEAPPGWHGWQPFAMYGRPMVGELKGVQGLQNLYIAGGFGPAGIKLAPFLMELLAQDILADVEVDTQPELDKPPQSPNLSASTITIQEEPEQDFQNLVRGRQETLDYRVFRHYDPEPAFRRYASDLKK
ncbi:unnamed protein product [Amoebophrya sp. A25]|nr:unnamed protein product [Amoebophrya sp. A25]|eukprot:GSA25T00000881001.1